MRRLLGTVPALALTALLLAGCGEDEEPTASDPAPTDQTSGTSETASDLPTTPDQDPDPDPDPDAVPFELLEIVHATAGGRGSTDAAVEITSSADLDTFVAGFSDELADEVEASYAATSVQEGQTLWVAVVGLGCDVPPGVDVVGSGDGYAITGAKVADPTPECFAPVTSVALVAIGD